MWKRIYAAAALVVPVMWNTAYADISPTLRMEFEVQQSDLSDVMKILTKYANDEGLTIENMGPRMPPRGGRPVFYVKLVRQDVTILIVTNFVRPDQMLIGYYAPTHGTDPQRPIEPLISEMRQRWPDIHVYTGL